MPPIFNPFLGQFPRPAPPAGSQASPAGQQRPGIGSRLRRTFFGSPEAAAASASGIAGIIESILANRAAGQVAESDREMLRARLLSGIIGDESGENFQRDQAYMQSFNMDPAGQQIDLARAAALNRLAQTGAARLDPSTGQLINTTSFGADIEPFLGQQGLASGAERFFGAQGRLQPMAPPADLTSMGFGDAGAAGTDRLGIQQAEARRQLEDLRSQRRQAVLQQLTDSIGGQQIPKGYEIDKKTGKLKKKGGLWKKLGKIASIAAPIIAAPFTGGATLALIGAGAGAAGGALSGGGLRGALLGGALGAIPTGGVVGQAAGQGVKAGLKQAVKDPNLYKNLLLGGLR